MNHPCSLLALAALALASASCTPTPDAPRAAAGGPRLAIAVAALELDGVVDACYALAVDNVARADLDPLDPSTQVFAASHICASRYGDRGGSIAYVGSCDADPDGRLNTVSLVLEGLCATPDCDVSDPDDPGRIAPTSYRNPCPEAEPCRLERPCRANGDTAVTFNLTTMRSADQGFFDVAVSFEDIFCSAKLDCLSALLPKPGGERALTLVMALACTAGPSADTCLYVDPVHLACDGFGAFDIQPSAPGNLAAAAVAYPLLFGGAVYRGDESLPTLQKSYWNVALGLEETAFTAAGHCRISWAATASEGRLPGDTTPDATAYPRLVWARDIVVNGALDCGHFGLDEVPQDETLAPVATDYVDVSEPWTPALVYCAGGPLCERPDAPDCSAVTDPCLQKVCNPATGACDLPVDCSGHATVCHDDNLALASRGTVATSTSVHESGLYGPERAIDGDLASEWVGAYCETCGTSTLELTLGEPGVLHALEIDGLVVERPIVDQALAYEDDQGTWRSVALTLGPAPRPGAIAATFAPITARRVRVTVTSADNAIDQTVVWEVALIGHPAACERGCASTWNVAAASAGAVATATAEHQEGNHPAAQAIDGNLQTPWVGPYCQACTPNTLTVELGGPRVISSFVLYGQTGSDDPTTAYTLEYDDGTAWQPLVVAEAPGLPLGHFGGTFAPVTTERVRVTVETPIINDPIQNMIYELEVYGTSSACRLTCVQDVCNPATGACDLPVEAGTTCNDDDACTREDICQDGACVGAALDCAGVTAVCLEPQCNPRTGACDLAKPEGTSCDPDGDPCNGDARCTDGSCQVAPSECLSAVLWRHEDGVILSGYPAIDDDGFVFAPEPASAGIAAVAPDGTLLWSGKKGSCSTFPANDISVGAGGLVYGVGDANTCNGGPLFAFDRAGNVAWTHTTCGNSPHPRHIPALDGDHGLVYLGSGDLCAIDAASGEDVWTAASGVYIGQNGIAIDSAGNVHRGTTDGTVHVASLTATGDARYHKTFGGPYGPTLTTVFDRHGSDAIVGVWVGPDPHIEVLDTNGDVIWSSHLVDSELVQDGAGHLFGTRAGASVVSLDVDGNLRWTKALAGESALSVDFVASNGVVLVRGARTVYALATADGNEVWRFELAHDITAGLVLTREGRLLVADAVGRTLFATALDYAASGWPKIHGNRRNTTRAHDDVPLIDTCVDGEPSEWRVNRSADGDQFGASIATLEDGTFAIAYVERRRLLVQRFARERQPIGPPVVVVDGPTSGDLQDAQVVARAGGFAVAWTQWGSDLWGHGPYLRIYDVHGGAIGGPQLIGYAQFGIAYGTKASPRPDGGFTVTWHGYSPLGPFARFFAADGTLLASSDSYGDAGGSYNYFGEASAALSDGRTVALWSPNGSAGRIRVFDASHAPTGPSLVVTDAAANSGAALAAGPSGSFIAAWAEADGDATGIWARRWGADLEPLGGAFLVNEASAGSQLDPAVAVDPASGSFTVVWSSTPAGGQADIRQRTFAADGSALTGELAVNTTRPGQQTAPALARLGDGSRLVAWTSYAAPGDLGVEVRARRFTALGAPLGACGEPSACAELASDFEQLTLGPASGQGGWSGASEWVVQDAYAHSGGQALYAIAPFGQNFRELSHALPSVSDLRLRLWLRRNTNHNHASVVFHHHGVFAGRFELNGNNDEYGWYDGSVELFPGVGVAYGQWQAVDLELDMDGLGGRFRIDEGAWSPWYATNGQTRTDEIRLRVEDTEGDLFVDDLQCPPF